jgi:replicative DNA helicase
MIDNFTHLAPQDGRADLAVEQSVLGVLLQFSDAPETIDVYATLAPEDFYAVKHRLIYAAIVGLYKAGNPVDMLTVTHALRASGKLEECGGAYYISELTAHVTGFSHVGQWALLLKEYAIRRNVHTVCAQFLAKCYDGETDVFDLVETLKTEAGAVLESANFSASPYRALGDMFADYMPKLDERQANHEPRGVPSGVGFLDNFLHGFEPGRLYVLAARPGVGKSALGLQVALNVSAYKPAAFFNFEMSAEETTERALAHLSGVKSIKMKLGKLDDEDYQDLLKAIHKTHKREFFFFDVANATVETLRRSILSLNRKKKLGLIVIDYLQLLRSSRNRVNRYEEITEISGALKRLAKEADAPILLLSQMNREIEKRSGGFPQNSDLRDSGSIEQDADVILFLTKDPDGEDDAEKKRALRLTISKNRNGPAGFTLKIKFDPRTYHFIDVDETEYEYAEPPF